MTQNILAVIAILFVIFWIGVLLILSLLDFWFPAQYLYLHIFCRTEEYYTWYKQAVNHIKSGHTIPAIFLSLYANMEVYEADKFKQFLNDNDFYYIVFPNGDINLYCNDKIVLSNFWKLSIYHLMKMAGDKNPEQTIKDIIREGKQEIVEHTNIRAKRFKELTKKLQINQ